MRETRTTSASSHATTTVHFSPLLGYPAATLTVIFHDRAFQPPANQAQNAPVGDTAFKTDHQLIAFAKSSFLLSPLPPTGGEGQGEGGRK